MHPHLRLMIGELINKGNIAFKIQSFRTSTIGPIYSKNGKAAHPTTSSDSSPGADGSTKYILWQEKPLDYEKRTSYSATNTSLGVVVCAYCTA
jgi:hypothetical protein